MLLQKAYVCRSKGIAMLALVLLMCCSSDCDSNQISPVNCTFTLREAFHLGTPLTSFSILQLLCANPVKPNLKAVLFCIRRHNQ